MVGLMTILGRRSALLESTRSHTSRRLREDVALRQADDLGEGVNAGAKRGLFCPRRGRRNEES
jgi:hypothetical protein